MNNASLKHTLALSVIFILASLGTLGQQNGQPGVSGPRMAVDLAPTQDSGPEAVHHHPWSHVLDSLKLLKQFLDLSEEQVEAIRMIVESTHEQVRDIQEVIQPLEMELKELINSDAPDPGEVGELVLLIHDLRREIVALVKAMGQAIEGELNEAQVVKLNHARAASRLQPLFPALRVLALIPPGPFHHGPNQPDPEG